jgi:hypothetical protein
VTAALLVAGLGTIALGALLAAARASFSFGIATQAAGAAAVAVATPLAPRSPVSLHSASASTA